MSLSTIAVILEQFAENVVNDAIAEGKQFAAEVVTEAKQFAENVVAKGYTDFMDLVNKVGLRATQLVTDLMADDTLSGLEKANLGATQLVEHAASNGITIAEQDVSALIKMAYEGAKAKIASL